MSKTKTGNTAIRIDTCKFDIKVKYIRYGWMRMNFKFNDFIIDFTADTSFMTSLQELVSKYNFAQYNGYISKVSGLPDMYGAKLDINYASGESIYAHDNQDCFIPFEAIEEFVSFFNSAYTE